MGWMSVCEGGRREEGEGKRVRGKREGSDKGKRGKEEERGERREKGRG